MKTLKSILFSFLILTITTTVFAQAKTEKIKVAGECGMCKSSIEKAAKSAGASYALWNEEAKALTFTYNSQTTNAAKIEKAVAGVGYDTANEKATNEAYDKLHGCCKYERATEAKSTAHNCCDGEKCKDESCMKGGCEKDKSCCKKAECATKDCCKKA